MTKEQEKLELWLAEEFEKMKTDAWNDFSSGYHCALREVRNILAINKEEK